MALKEFYHYIKMSCHECHVDIRKDKTNFYMVQDQLWYEFGVGKGYLCLPCFEKRLGRPLVLEDFPDVTCNIRDNPFFKKLIDDSEHVDPPKSGHL